MTEERIFPDRIERDANGIVRKAHYGDGRQPWDDIVDMGWAPHFAAGCILRYLRRTKDTEHSLQSARWYWDRLIELTRATGKRPMAMVVDARQTKEALAAVLTDSELRALTEWR